MVDLGFMVFSLTTTRKRKTLPKMQGSKVTWGALSPASWRSAPPVLQRAHCAVIMPPVDRILAKGNAVRCLNHCATAPKTAKGLQFMPPSWILDTTCCMRVRCCKTNSLSFRFDLARKGKLIRISRMTIFHLSVCGEAHDRVKYFQETRIWVDYHCKMPRMLHAACCMGQDAALCHVTLNPQNLNCKDMKWIKSVRMCKGSLQLCLLDLPCNGFSVR